MCRHQRVSFVLYAYMCMPLCMHKNLGYIHACTYIKGNCVYTYIIYIYISVERGGYSFTATLRPRSHVPPQSQSQGFENQSTAW